MAKTILIVDDVATDRAAVRETVKKLGYLTIEASNGAVAVSMAKEQKPDAILMDVVMPEMSGFEATREILADESTKYIPIVIVSSRAQKSDFHRANLIGAKGYVTKPVDAAALTEALKAIA